MLGPVVKIDPASLPHAPNIHYLGMKAYADLPAYLAGWDVGMLPFALNESTRFISPTKTPEYLAAGLRVISSPIRDVVTPYGDLGLVEIVKDAGEFIRVADSLLASPQSKESRAAADRFLAQSSWDKTWTRMNDLINTAIISKRAPAAHLEAGSLAMEGANRV
jgi:UDP-galactopyranose mutase